MVSLFSWTPKSRLMIQCGNCVDGIGRSWICLDPGLIGRPPLRIHPHLRREAELSVISDSTRLCGEPNVFIRLVVHLLIRPDSRIDLYSRILCCPFYPHLPTRECLICYCSTQLTWGGGQLPPGLPDPSRHDLPLIVPYSSKLRHPMVLFR
jgi:hypothetical protein